MPFITILRAKHGTILGYVAVAVPRKAEIPPWPAETNAAPTVVASLTPIAQTSAIPALVFTGKKPKPAGSTKSSEIAPIRESAPAVASPAPAPAADGPAEPRASEPSHVVPETLPIAPTPKTTVIEQKVQPSETPQHPAEPAAIVANTAVASDTTPKVETVLPLVATVSNSSNAAPAETVE